MTVPACYMITGLLFATAIGIVAAIFTLLPVSSTPAKFADNSEPTLAAIADTFIHGWTCKILIMFAVPVTLIACATSEPVTVTSGPALAPAEFSTPPVGTKLQWRNTSTGFAFTRTVKESDKPYSVGYFTENGEQRNVYMFCNYCGAASNTIDVDTYSKLFPLQVGKKIDLQRYRVGDSSRSWRHRIVVERTDMIDVPFSNSPLATYVIEETIWNNRSNWSGTVTYWYAPSISIGVKVVDNAQDNPSLKYTYELANYTLP